MNYGRLLVLSFLAFGAQISFAQTEPTCPTTITGHAKLERPMSAAVFQERHAQIQKIIGQQRSSFVRCAVYSQASTRDGDLVKFVVTAQGNLIIQEIQTDEKLANCIKTVLERLQFGTAQICPADLPYRWNLSFPLVNQERTVY